MHVVDEAGNREEYGVDGKPVRAAEDSAFDHILGQFDNHTCNIYAVMSFCDRRRRGRVRRRLGRDIVDERPVKNDLHVKIRHMQHPVGFQILFWWFDARLELHRQAIKLFLEFLFEL